jgi:hypothetical protein
MADAEADAALQAQITAAVVAVLAAQAAAVPAVPVVHVAVKLPDFWVKDPKMWFSQAEAQFRGARIMAESTMYDYILMNYQRMWSCLSGLWFRRLRQTRSNRRILTLS